jgi:hypothetical protein
VVTEYRDHGGRLFKVYVIDEDVLAFERSSLPDIEDLACQLHGSEKVIVGARSIVFDSRHAYPTRADFCPSESDVKATALLRSAPSIGAVYAYLSAFTYLPKGYRYRSF